jgi:hypothetical protein
VLFRQDMKKANRNKLTLSTERIRDLQPEELSRAAGGLDGKTVAPCVHSLFTTTTR